MTKLLRTSSLLALAVLLLTSLVLSTPANSAELKIGYANLQKALNSCEAGKKAKTELDSEYDTLEKKLSEEQSELKKMKAEIESKASVWNKETFEKKERAFITKGQAFQKRFVEARENLNSKLKSKESKILGELQAIVKETAEKKGYDFVFEYSLGAILHAPKDVDITDELIELHNKRN
ncbi:MAG: OmpH family outer membrane protein [Deltaproteobacteria bacterium]|nr:OmpH family outer membrane protein [Deltaproteobacteria bacterium]